ncbi:MAG: glycosyltransferase family 2 protein [Muribaculaceae bacterium]
MNDTHKISVGIPIYNCGKYIEKCASSLLEQTYTNIEYVFVDDCSTDDTLISLQATINKYPHRKEQIKIIKLTINGGLANARNAAIESMTGDYYTFCDGDDWIEHNAYASMISKAQKTNADIVCTPFFVNKKDKQSISHFPNTNICELNTIPLNAIHFSLCNKLIKSNLFTDNGIKVLENVNCWEDLSIVARLFTLSNNVVILDTPYYHYRKQGKTSLTTSCHKRILKDHITCAILLDRWFRAQGSDIYDRYAPFILFLKFTAKIKMLRGREKEIANWKATFPETNLHIMSFHNIPIHYRLLFKTVNSLPTRITQPIANAIQIFYE